MLNAEFRMLNDRLNDGVQHVVSLQWAPYIRHSDIQHSAFFIQH